MKNHDLGRERSNDSVSKLSMKKSRDRPLVTYNLKNQAALKSRLRMNDMSVNSVISKPEYSVAHHSK